MKLNTNDKKPPVSSDNQRLLSGVMVGNREFAVLRSGAQFTEKKPACQKWLRAKYQKK